MDFNSQAASWDSDSRIKRAQTIANEILHSIEIKEKLRALEFGCGTGLVSFNLIDQFEHITLVDTSKGMIDTLQAKIQANKVKNMTALNLDINNSAMLKNSSFDIIYTSMALHHIKEIKQTLDNLCLLLDEDGYLCIVELTEDDGSFHKNEKGFDGHNGFNQDQLKLMLTELGLTNVTSNVFYHDIKHIEDEEINYSLFLMIAKK